MTDRALSGRRRIRWNGLHKEHREHHSSHRGACRERSCGWQAWTALCDRTLVAGLHSCSEVMLMRNGRVSVVMNGLLGGIMMYNQ